MTHRDWTEDLVAVLALLGITILGVLRTINSDAVVALYSATLGFVFGRKNGYRNGYKDGNSK